MVSINEGKSYAKSINAPFFETSGKIIKFFNKVKIILKQNQELI